MEVHVIVLGLILVIVGAAVLYLVGDRFARFAGVVLVALGLVLVLVGALDVADVPLSG